MVLNPSSAALPGLSVTPGLNPIVTTMSGSCENNSLSLKCSESVALASIIGSAKTSSALLATSAAEISLEIKNPTIDLTLPISMSWSAASWRFTESPRTSLIPSPSLGVASTLTIFDDTVYTCPLWGQTHRSDYRP